MSDFQCVFYVCKRLVRHTQLFVHVEVCRRRKYFRVFAFIGRVILVSRLFFVSTIYIFEEGEGRIDLILLDSFPWDTWPYLAFNLKSKRENYGMVNSIGNSYKRAWLFVSFMYLIGSILQPIHIAYDTHWLKHRTHLGTKRFFTTSNEMFIGELYFTSLGSCFSAALLPFSMIKCSLNAHRCFLKYFHEMCRINRYILVIFNSTLWCAKIPNEWRKREKKKKKSRS